MDPEEKGSIDILLKKLALYDNRKINDKNRIDLINQFLKHRNEKKKDK
jgi:hypothetical protein